MIYRESLCITTQKELPQDEDILRLIFFGLYIYIR